MVPADPACATADPEERLEPATLQVPLNSPTEPDDGRRECASADLSNAPANTSRAPTDPQECLSGLTVLCFFCCIQFLTYFDRGVMSGLLTYAEAKWALDGEESGLLGSSYFISVMVVAPFVAGALVGSRGKLQMYGISFGSFLWAIAAGCCFLAPSYTILLAGRILTGLGEAFYCVLASPIIDDSAPSGKKSLYLGAFYALVYVATGIGFVAPSFSTGWDSGRLVFLAEAVVMLPVILFGVVYASRFHHESAGEVGTCDNESQGVSEHGCKSSIMLTWGVLFNRSYFLFFMGYGALIFTLNGWNFWGPAYMQEVMQLSKSRGSIELGGMVVGAGLAGSAVGGLLLDRITARGNKGRCIASARVSFFSVMFALPFGIAATATRSPWIFLLVAAFFFFFLTMSTAPCCVGMMEAVAPSSRGIAMGLGSFGAHIFGDVLSPFIVGVLQDKYGSLVPGMWMLVFWCLVTMLFWGIASLPSNSTPTSVPSSRTNSQAIVAEDGISAVLVASSSSTGLPPAPLQSDVNTDKYKDDAQAGMFSLQEVHTTSQDA